ncbi:MAG: hypothetical protein KJN84_15705 [Bacteroidia bacterium]|nr:hypothetical protein [Bacteroidia bacterium]
MLFGFLDKGVKPSTEYPWYFIYEDFRQFLSVSLFTMITVIIIFAFRKKLIPQIYFASLAILFFVIPILYKGIIIIMNCENIFNPELATTNWATQSQYLSDIYNYWMLVPLIVILLLITRNLNKVYKNNTRQEYQSEILAS